MVGTMRPRIPVILVTAYPELLDGEVNARSGAV
jgi:hypothetical protein